MAIISSPPKKQQGLGSRTGKDMEKLETLYTISESINVAAIMKTMWRFLTKIKNKIAQDLAIPIPCIL